MVVLEKIASSLDDAVVRAEPIAQFDPQGSLSLTEAYEIQNLSVKRRLARGERRVGVKMGFTSRAKMAQMGLQDVIWGRLTDAMQVEEGGFVDFKRFIHPRVEPELAFVLKHSLTGNESCAQALAAVEAIAPALEVIDSRYSDFKFSLPEVIADNASSSAFVVGRWQDPHTNFGNLGLVLSIDGRVVQVGSTASILGQPMRSLVAAARLAAAAGEPLQAGWTVMAGGATQAEWIKPGQFVQVELEGMGNTGFHVSDIAREAA